MSHHKSTSSQFNTTRFDPADPHLLSAPPGEYRDWDNSASRARRRNTDIRHRDVDTSPHQIAGWLVGLVAVGLLGSACTPISAETRIEETLIGEETRQELVAGDLQLDTSVQGTDPRTDGAVQLSLTVERQCEERTVRIYERKEITERRIGNWSVPITLGLVGVTGGLCAATHANQQHCVEPDDGDGPSTRAEHLTTAGLFGSIALTSAVVLGADMYRTRDSAVFLDDGTDVSEGRLVNCGTAPADDVTVEYGYTDGAIVWQGSTDRNGALTIPVHQLDWIDDGYRQSVGVIDVDGLGSRELGAAPEAWVEIRDEVRVEQQFAQARQRDTLDAWLQLYAEYSHGERGQEAFDEFADTWRAQIQGGHFSESAEHIKSMQSLDIPEQHREALDDLRIEWHLARARAAATGNHEMSHDDILHDYAQAASLHQEASRVYQEAFDYGIEALEAAIDDDTFGDDDSRWSGDTLDTLASFAQSSEQQQRLDEAADAATIQIAASMLADARRLREDDDALYDDVQRAYSALLDSDEMLDALPEEDRRAAHDEFEAVLLEPLEFHVEQGQREQAEAAFENIESTVDDVEPYLTSYRQMVFDRLRQTIATGNSDSPPDYDDWAMTFVDGPEDEIELFTVMARGMSDYLQDAAQEEPELAVQVGRAVYQRPGAILAGDLEGAREIIDDEEDRLRRDLRAEVSLSQLSVRQNVAWLFPPHLESSGQLNSLMAAPSNHVGQRVLTTLTVQESIGDGMYLAQETTTSEQVVASGNFSTGARITVLARVSDTVPDGRAGREGNIPKLTVLWIE